MTDKQIIINGVDVGWCKNYNEANSKDCETLYICAENPNCYYKQLKRSEAQCEGMFVSHTDLEKKYKTLEEENRSLKSELMQTNCYLDADKEIIDQLKAENKTQKETIDGFLTILDKLGESNIKLREILTEIKEIAEECYYKCNPINNCNISCKYYNDCNGEFSYLLAYLNKQISEVENGHTKED